MQSVLREVGIAIGLPFEVLIKHFTASYSASRPALLGAWRFFRNRRQRVADGFCQPIYEAFMDEAVSSGRISAPGYFDEPPLRKAYLQAQWLSDSPMADRSGEMQRTIFPGRHIQPICTCSA